MFLKKIIVSIFIFVLAVSMLNANTDSSDQVKDQSKSLLPERMIAGFLDIRTPGSLTRVDMSEAKKDGYNVIIVAFGEIYENGIGFYTSEGSSISSQSAIDKIRSAQKLGMKVLISVGGIPNTFHPGVKKGSADPKVFGKDMTKADIDQLANNIVTFLHKYKMSGIVYSIKRYTSSSFLDSLSAKIKELDPELVVAAEPEVNNYHLVTTGKSNDYDLALKNGNIDYLFIQEYNSFKESDPNFISESYAKIIDNSDIPSATKIVINEPTNSVSGGTNTIYHPESECNRVVNH